MIGLAMEKWPDDALRRVVDAPVEEWFLTWDGCLACHRYGGYGAGFVRKEGAASFDPRLVTTHRDRETYERWADDYSWPEAHPIFGGHGRYVRLVRRFELPRTVRAIKLRALRILLDRHPLDSNLAVLKAGTF